MDLNLSVKKAKIYKVEKYHLWKINILERMSPTIKSRTRIMKDSMKDPKISEFRRKLIYKTITLYQLRRRKPFPFPFAL
jgi:hypothetical protein